MNCCSKCKDTYKDGTRCSDKSCVCHVKEKAIFIERKLAEFDEKLENGDFHTRRTSDEITAQPVLRVDWEKIKSYFSTIIEQTEERVAKIEQIRCDEMIAKERERVIKIVVGQSFKIHLDDYLKKVEAWDGINYDVPFDSGYNQAISDLLTALKEDYK